MRASSITFSLAVGFIVLILLTIGAMLWQHLGMNIERDLVKPGISDVSVFTDRVNGGVSSAALDSGEDTITLRCTIRNNNQTHPFCGFTIKIASAPDGIDLSRYRQLQLILSYDTDSQDTLLVYLINQEYRPHERERSNMRPLNLIKDQTEYHLPIESFFVPSWWMYLFPDDPLHGQVNMDNVTALRITSGDNTQSRDAVIRLQKATLTGKLISKSELYFILISLWITVILTTSIATLVCLYRKTRMQSVKNQQLQTMVKTDPLTGTLNRAGLDNELLTIRLSDKEDQHIHSVIYCDIDHFKQVNDQFGHGKGDEILIGLTGRIRESIRHSDCLVRMGGEEFLILCKNIMLKDAESLAEKLRSKIASEAIAGISITCSFGVTECYTSQLHNAIDEADAYLYLAKQSGRNKVCSRSHRLD